MTVGYLHKGEGRTVSMSRTEVIFEALLRLPVGKCVRLSIEWPVKLDNEIPLTLDVHGRTVAAQGNRVSVEILRHEFLLRPKGRAASA